MFRLRKSYPLINSSYQFIRNYQRNYYDLLGLSPKATHGDIKKAYYKLSMQYHPDKTEGDETKFREITSAYEVLGNIKLRRLYDQGLISHAGRSNPSPEDISEAADAPRQESRFYRSKVPMSGKTKIYDFDEWSRMHYDKVRSRDFEVKTKQSNARRRAYNDGQQTVSEWVLVGTSIFLVLFLFAISSFSRDYDTPSKKPRRDDS